MKSNKAFFLGIVLLFFAAPVTGMEQTPISELQRELREVTEKIRPLVSRQMTVGKQVRPKKLSDIEQATLLSLRDRQRWLKAEIEKQGKARISPRPPVPTPQPTRAPAEAARRKPQELEEEIIKMVKELSLREQKNLGDIIKQSRNNYFLTDDSLLWQVLKLEGLDKYVQTVPVYGKIFQISQDISHNLRVTSPFFYLVSIQQVDNLCGFASIANAFAIQAQMNAYNFVNTRQLATDALNDITRSPIFLESACLGAAALALEHVAEQPLRTIWERMGLRNNQLFFLEQPMVEAFNALPAFKQKWIADLTNAIKGYKDVQVILNRGHHWSLLSIVKDRTGAIALLHLDSSNKPPQGLLELSRFFAIINEAVERAKQ